MLASSIVLILVSIIIPLLFRNNSKGENDKQIVFEFYIAFRIVMLVCMGVFIAIAVLFLVVALNNNNKNSELIGVIIFAVFSLLCSIVFIIFKNKKIIYSEDVLYYYNLFGKQKKFNVQDIQEAIENTDCGMKLIFKDGKKLKVDVEMMNYSKIKDILDEHNIKYKDTKGNNTPKGW